MSCLASTIFFQSKVLSKQPLHVSILSLNKYQVADLQPRILDGHCALQDAVVPLQIRQLAPQRRRLLRPGRLRTAPIP